MRPVIIAILVLIPSMTFAQKVTHVVKLKNGQELNIELVSETSKKVVYWDSNGKRATILKDDIESLEPLIKQGSIIEINKLDDMTGSSIKRTFWDKLIEDIGNNRGYYYRISKLDEFYYFSIKVNVNEVCSVNENDKLILKLSNGEMINLKNLKYSLSCAGCGAIGLNRAGLQGVAVDFLLDKEDIDKLKQNSIVKLRLYTSVGYIESEVKEKYSIKFIEALNELVSLD